MKQKILFLLMVIFLSGQTGLLAGTCTGSSNCRVCSNCSQCQHCAKRGGSCGVCENRKDDSVGIYKKKENSSWNPDWTWIIVGLMGLYILIHNNKQDK